MVRKSQHRTNCVIQFDPISRCERSAKLINSSICWLDLSTLHVAVYLPAYRYVSLATFTHTRTHTYTRARARAHTHTHTYIYINIERERERGDILDSWLFIGSVQLQLKLDATK